MVVSPNIPWKIVVWSSRYLFTDMFQTKCSACSKVVSLGFLFVTPQIDEKLALKLQTQIYANHTGPTKETSITVTERAVRFVFFWGDDFLLILLVTTASCQLFPQHPRHETNLATTFLGMSTFEASVNPSRIKPFYVPGSSNSWYLDWTHPTLNKEYRNILKNGIPKRILPGWWPFSPQGTNGSLDPST